MLTARELIEARGESVIDPEGQPIGTLEAIYYDDGSGEPEWVSIRAAGDGRTFAHLVPLQGASRNDGHLVVAFRRERVEGSPPVDSDEISAEAEREIYAAYGIAYPPAMPQSGEPLAMEETPQGLAGSEAAQRWGADEPQRTAGGAPHRAATNAANNYSLDEEHPEQQPNRGRLRPWVENESIPEEDIPPQD